MKIYRYLAVLCCLFVLPLLLTSLIVGKDTKRKLRVTSARLPIPPVFVPQQIPAVPRLLRAP